MDQFKRFNNERHGKMTEMKPVGNSSFNESNFLLLGSRTPGAVDNINNNKLLLNKSSSLNSNRDEDNNNSGLINIRPSNKVFNNKQFQENGTNNGPQLMIDQNMNISRKIYAEDESESMSIKKQKSKRKLTKRDKIVSQIRF
jgi:hypothetical protein